MAGYDAFISYSHARDKPVAAALQAVIQKLGKPWYRRRALRVFRDDTSLSATPSLWPSIEQALSQSRYLILFASPEAAASSWVNKEVAYWLDHKSIDTLLVALTDGELAWDNALGDFAWRENMPLPPALTGRFATEPKWIDLRAYREGANPRDSRFIEHAADFAAAVHGMPKEDLLSQEVRQQRRALTLAWSAAGTLAVLIALAGWQWWEAEAAKRVAQTAEQLAQEQRDRAERNFAIAKDTANDVVFRIAGDLRDVQGMRVESVRKILDTARTMIDGLARAAPDDLTLQRSRYAMLFEFATTFQMAGDLAGALAAAEEALAIIRKLAAAAPGNVEWQRDLNLSLVQIGDLRLAGGDRERALAAYEESLALRRRLAAAEPDNAKWQRDLAIGLIKIGDARRAAGESAGALAAYRESLAIARRLAAAEPTSTGLQRDVYVSLIKVGDLSRSTGDADGALAAYEDSLAYARKLSAGDPGNSQWRRDISVSLDRVGDVRLDRGDRAAALAAFEESLAIRRKLAAIDPRNTIWQRDVSVSLTKIGDVRLETGDRPGALSAYEDSLAIVRNLVAADPNNAEWLADLVVGLVKVSMAAEPPRSRKVLVEALATAEKLEREGKLAGVRRDWPPRLRAMLAKLPPETAGAP
jgi:tetratricopeptide (TPR) repeat protein